MRLTHIKLAGFKSFVDPTVIPVPAQLTGVVGPNGCGKSNVIDAVRWVLGESSAKHLRGESMQDVIFNGSGTRKPASRASVELAFNNELGRAAGQWSQYAEISVKRVLDRSGDSTYYINNMRVRRRDVADLFLGTGVGARAYAIIEQGMITRLIEAKPEELRGYLEEAAGVSKYRERRKETESRLKDARDNLNRVEDIQRELKAQVEKLTAQAEVAQHYKQLQADLTFAQHRLWFARKHDAAQQRARIDKDLTEAQNKLEAETARLRHIESTLETARQTQFAGQDTLNAAQAAYYQAQSEVARIEQTMAHQNATRERLYRQVQDLGARVEAQQARRTATQDALHEVNTQQPGLEAVLMEAEAAARQATDSTLPEKEAALRVAQQGVGDAQRVVSQLDQSRQVDENSLGHTKRQLEQLDARQRRLAQEQAQLPRPDAAGLAQKQVELEELAQTLATAQAGLKDAETALPELDAARAQHMRDLEAARKALHQTEAELAALKKLQESLKADEKLGTWLHQRGLDSAPRLWEKLRVAPGWEAAVEAVLRERLQSVSADVTPEWFADAPPARLTVWAGQGAATASAPDLLASKIASDDAAAHAVLADWLTGVYWADDADTARARAASLAAGETVVTPQGHLFTRHSVTFHGPHTAVEGILARGRELERLTTDAVRLRDEVAQLEAAYAEAQQGYMERQRDIQALRAQTGQTQNRHHTAQMELLRLQQAVERVQSRAAQITQELEEVTRQQTGERATLETLEARLKDYRAQDEAAREALYAARQQRDQADRAVFDARELQRAAERRHQEAGFALTTCTNKIRELAETLARIEQEIADDDTRLTQAREELARLPADALDAELQAALVARTETEAALAAARDALEGLTAQLRGHDEARLACEQGLDPLRRTIEQLKLKDQEAMLMQSQFELQLREAAADEASLESGLADSPKPSQLQADINRLQNEIAALGAVNLAALDELTQAQERAEYLAAQCADLLEAVTTLEDAIRRIDQESRARLKETFDTVNQHMGELFPQLFGGGQARLILTGDELLDAGVQVFAQPPGKKNASIHLLSGGEKTLTALSLVFAMFKLNPAPFCLLDEVDAPLDDANTERYCNLVKAMSDHTQFLFITHNRVTMEMAQHLAGVTMQEQGVSRIVAVDVDEAVGMVEAA
ncbi:chromosome segregation protein SMC [Thiobacillus sp.]|uniref:chromosome segregation protein SMC n=1 Tax=Thiobacillus sp. TaxID=924 RepID=UPI00178D4F8D|nr:chromosome segregation protein SMC [Thiobacillus sp.]MBC2731112.1 chromosome segregation protein SMC [Thiobacillus sp.]MBC2739849.1 chromosome segregation protein SMC [Thiobacillus sp.]MBC2758845.1 chromosome segregation protein SMC [Thiobacillus sp.]